MESDRRAVVDQSTWRNWILLVATCVVSTAGLGIALLPLVESHLQSPWPWVKTEVALVVGLSLVVVTFVTYLTWQQLRLNALRKSLRQMEAERTQRMRQHYDRLIALLRVSRMMGSESDPRAVFNAITETCHETFDSDRVSLMLLDPDTGDLVVESARGRGVTAEMIGTRLPLGQGIAGWVAQKGQPMIVGRATNPDTFGPNVSRLDSRQEAMVVPIVVRNELVGVLNVGSRAPETSYDDEDLKALQVFAENAGSCIRHAERAQWMRQTIEQLRARAQTAAAPTRPADPSRTPAS